MVEQCSTLFTFEDIDRKQNNKKAAFHNGAFFYINKNHLVNAYRSAFHNEDDDMKMKKHKKHYNLKSVAKVRKICELCK